jgi:hypothetical protein
MANKCKFEQIMDLNMSQNRDIYFGMYHLLVPKNKKKVLQGKESRVVLIIIFLFILFVTNLSLFCDQATLRSKVTNCATSVSKF